MIREASPNPALTIPASWPKFGTLNGERIELRVDAPMLPPSDLVDVEVDVPRIGKTRPWKGSDYAFDDESGEVVL